MSDRASRDRIILDPHFAIPPGAEDAFAYALDSIEPDEFVDDLSDIEDGASDDYLDPGDDTYYEDDATVLDVPTNVLIVAQTLRRAPGGQAVVDVVIQVDDVIGAANYEIQVVKV